ncbi:PEP-CTERM sorting domain-containing protein [Sphingoaurantiacus capsulatus]|uniref:PEP-CTERM sorting domain-containing protein n=1 Tax=Sphingoaurantiacus capsulatus TaxID=1771310 RepID=A0ABV7X586_9SPHN
MLNLKLAALTAVALTALPASAAIVRYDVIAGGQNNSWAQHTTSFCYYSPSTAPNCGNTTHHSETNFGLTGRFIVNGDNLPTDTDNNPNRMYYSQYNNSFMTASMTKTGGTMALPTPTTDGGDRSIMYSNGSTYQLYGQTTAGHGWQYEYHSNGRVARQWMRDQFLDMFLYTPGVVTSVIDGDQFATAFGPFNTNSHLRSFDRITQYTWDSAGRQTSYTENTKYVWGRVQSINAERVPEPAALGLFGLGVVGLGLRRRRKG